MTPGRSQTSVVIFSQSPHSRLRVSNFRCLSRCPTTSESWNHTVLCGICLLNISYRQSWKVLKKQRGTPLLSQHSQTFVTLVIFSQSPHSRLRVSNFRCLSRRPITSESWNHTVLWGICLLDVSYRQSWKNKGVPLCFHNTLGLLWLTSFFLKIVWCEFRTPVAYLDVQPLLNP